LYYFYFVFYTIAFMPRRKKGKKQKSGKTSGGSTFNSVTKVPFRHIVLTSGTSGSTTALVYEVSLNVASLGDRIIDLGDTFAYFRISSLRVTAHVNPLIASSTTTSTSPDDVNHAVGFIPLPPGNYTAPTALAQCVDFPEFRVASGRKSVSFSVGPSGLYHTTPTKWYACGTQGSAEFITAGTITGLIQNTIATAVTQYQQVLVISGVAEFKEPIDTALIPLGFLERRLQRDREMLDRRLIVCEESTTEPVNSFRRGNYRVHPPGGSSSSDEKTVRSAVPTQQGLLGKFFSA